jgi:hypothetical protein
MIDTVDDEVLEVDDDAVVLVEIVLVDDVDEVDAAVVVLEIPVVVVATPDSAAPPCLTFIAPTFAKLVGLNTYRYMVDVGDNPGTMARDVAGALIKDGLLLSHPTPYGLYVSLNPRRAEDIKTKLGLK